MKCEYCGKEMTDDSIKCASCGSWISDINRTQTKYYSILAVSIPIAMVFGLRIKALSFSIERILNDPLSVILFIAGLVGIIIGEITGSKLKKMKKGKLF